MVGLVFSMRLLAFCLVVCSVSGLNVWKYILQVFDCRAHDLIAVISLFLFCKSNVGGSPAKVSREMKDGWVSFFYTLMMYDVFLSVLTTEYA